MPLTFTLIGRKDFIVDSSSFRKS